MTYYTLIPLFALLFNVSFATYAWARHPGNRTCQAFLLYAASMIGWELCDVFLWSTIPEYLYVPLMRFETLFWAPSAFLFLNFVYTLLEKARGWVFYSLLVLHAAIIVAGAFSPFVIAGHEHFAWGVSPTEGPLYYSAISILIFSGVLASGMLMMVHHQTPDSLRKRELRLVLAGTLSILLAGIATNVVLPHLLPLQTIPELASSLFPFQSFFLMFAISRYGFLSVGIGDVAKDLFTQIHDSVLVFDRNQRLVDANSAAREMLAITDDQLYRLKASELFPSTYSFGSEYEEHTIHLYAHGSRKTVILSQNPLRSGEVTTGVLSILRDITEQEESEQELRRAHELVSQASEAKSNFLRNISHEIRTPLNAILGFSELISSSRIHRNCQEYGDSIVRESDRLIRLVNQLLDIAKIEAGKLELEKIEFSLQMIADDILENYRQASEAKGLYFQTTLAEDIPARLVGDPLRFGEILINLLGNAVKFTERGSIKVSAKVKDRNNDEVVLLWRVEDTGIGIPRTKLATIFDTFIQADASTTREHGGSGLGTAIAKQLAQVMGGAIGAMSELGKGSIFWFTVKMGIGKSESKNEFKESLQSTAEALKGTKVLLVEDNVANQEIGFEHLTDAGCSVTIAPNGKQAIDCFGSAEFDVVLMDVQMPIMDGHVATKEIRRMRRGDTTPVIGMTATVFQTDIEKCMAAGMDDVLSKPVWRKELLSAVGKWKTSGRIKPSASQDTVDLSGQASNGEDSESPIDLSGLLQEMRGNAQVVDRIVSGFIERLDKQLENTANALAAEDWDTANREAHSIKGGALSIRAVPLAAAARKLEEATQEGCPLHSSHLLDSLRIEISKLKNYPLALKAPEA